MIRVVIDANVLFSALIKNSLTARIIFEEDIVLNAPEFVVEEFLKYEELILKKISRTKEEFVQIMHMLKEIIRVVPKEEYAQFIEEAEQCSPDEKDVMYVALALKLKIAVWSNDKKLKQQDRVKVYSTEELKNELMK
ncbi:PIN domain-containing protein [Candidatus Woesearchaeota archaeon]|nr:PIN domain-containing protein [Candidatus Woesearchaeota archaeon]